MSCIVVARRDGAVEAWRRDDILNCTGDALPQRAGSRSCIAHTVRPAATLYGKVQCIALHATSQARKNTTLRSLGLSIPAHV